ncbi:MAG: hypothetical protein ACRECQ_02740 [Burkholderiaceae bacterium]
MAPLSAVVGLALAFASAMPVMAASSSAVICQSGSSELPVNEARVLAFGNYRGPTASQDSQAQRFFDQGLVFGWGFNFPEAVRSFRAAARIDPACALCRWGVAWALGPSINHEMRGEDRPLALDAIVQARVYAEPRSRERALIDALAARYEDANSDYSARAYASAMVVLAEQFAHDADIAVLAAEAMMNAHPYDYWASNGRPKSWTPQIMTLLDRALRIAPDHPGAHHYNIHLFEESREPKRALSSAEQLGALAPIVGHLVHMPSHIYFRLGRYQQAVNANQAAVDADRAYLAASGAQSGYAIHNLHFLWASALRNGDSPTALRVAEELAAASSQMSDGLRQHLMAAPALTRVRFAQWDAIATQPSPDHSPYLSGLMHFARGMMHAARGDVGAARADLDSLQRSRRQTKAAGLTIKNINQADDVLNVARLQLQSAIARARGANGEAIRQAHAAARAEDRLAADDPPVWLIPSRRALAGLAAERRLHPRLTSSSLSAQYVAPLSK